MIVTVLFISLSTLAIVGAGGVLLCRRVTHCISSFLLCGTALAGLYMLLNLPFLAATQFVIDVCLIGALIAPGIVTLFPPTDRRRLPWYILCALPLLALICWGIAHGTLGEPVLSSPPVWTTQGEHAPALGRELLTHHLVPFMLLGLLLFVGLTSTGYLIRQDQGSPHKEREK